MSKKIKMPCLRGLRRFDKTGCPRREWDEVSQDGCPVWRVLIEPDPGNPLKKVTTGDCIDSWTLKFNYTALGMTEGVQNAIESFRNGMVDDLNGVVAPKPDRGVLALIKLVEDSQKKLEYERKEIGIG